ncbi:MAG: threonylcarbamoyl-AMP synthase [Holosporales bacterium]|jgi:L-threonylcarbamoyladenylate synthase|nr:threonylcarbamoyl-AMP synthase [Holosporales bacterium]
MSRLLSPSSENLQIARAHLLAGGLVVFPTETVYGIGALATCDDAVLRIYRLKNRPIDKPLALHSIDAADVWTYVEKTTPACLLADAFWPGPLTLILKRRPGTCLDHTMALKGDTLATHVVRHPAATALIKGLGLPLMATSANASGFLSPVNAADVIASFPQEKGLLVLDGGKTAFCIESTIIDLTQEEARVLRYGAISREEIEACLGSSVLPLEARPLESCSFALRLNAETPSPEEAFLAFGPVEGDLSCAAFLNLSPSGNLEEASRNLFSMLKRLKASEASGIAVAPIPFYGLGAAINERLMKFR